MKIVGTILITALGAASLVAAAPAIDHAGAKRSGGGNNIADSAAGLAKSIQGGNGLSIADAALGLASSIAGGKGGGAAAETAGAGRTKGNQGTQGKQSGGDARGGAGNSIADSTAGLANSIQGGNGLSIADAALGLASSIAGGK